MARKKRVDSKGRVLKVGESQRKDGLYMYRFTDDTGERQTIYANNIIELREQEQEIQKAEKENREAIEMPEFSAYIMRHTFCTRLCENDLNVKTTQSIMGHADIKTTMNIYTHVTEEKKQQELSKLNNIKIS